MNPKDTFTPDSEINGENDKIQSNIEFASKLLPILKDQKPKRTWTGLLPYTKDGRALIGRLNCLKGQVYMISGLRSHGMMKGPGAGMLLAGLMCGDKIATAVLSETNPDRCVKLTTNIMETVSKL